MPRIPRAPSTHCPGLSISPFQVVVDPMLQWAVCPCLWSHTGALGRGEAGCFPMEVAGLWEPGPKVLGVPVCKSCTLTGLAAWTNTVYLQAKPAISGF